MVNPITTNLRCNEQIRISPIRVIGPENEQLGVLGTAEALRMAYDQGMDLVEVSPNTRPPVCRIMDYGKWKYQQKKGQKKHHEQELKEVRLRPKTDTHDLEIKIKHAIEFLRDGDKVQFTMVFRGRERAHREVGLATYQTILAELGDRAKVERPASIDGKNMVMIVAPGRIEKPAEPAARPPAGDKPAERAPVTASAPLTQSLNIPAPATQPEAPKPVAPAQPPQAP
ncbi:MAG: translation initiation factor IF-3 [Planctomycetia bacterium]|nr:MAG: translation initiation factor IF-3 [Planctomycetia bacterium]